MTSSSISPLYGPRRARRLQFVACQPVSEFAPLDPYAGAEFLCSLEPGAIIHYKIDFENFLRLRVSEWFEWPEKLDAPRSKWRTRAALAAALEDDVFSELVLRCQVIDAVGGSESLVEFWSKGIGNEFRAHCGGIYESPLLIARDEYRNPQEL